MKALLVLAIIYAAFFVLFGWFSYTGQPHAEVAVAAAAASLAGYLAMVGHAVVIRSGPGLDELP